VRGGNEVMNFRALSRETTAFKEIRFIVVTEDSVKFSFGPNKITLTNFYINS
jgi:hypothetical protein